MDVWIMCLAETPELPSGEILTVCSLSCKLCSNVALIIRVAIRQQLDESQLKIKSKYVEHIFLFRGSWK